MSEKKLFNNDDVLECANIAISLQREVKNLCNENARLKDRNGELYEALKDITNQIARSRMGSIGSINNVYLPQIGVKEVKRLRAVLDRAEGRKG